ncbi:2-hydroxychromene-2-carboxylate isomerase [Rhodovibrionaceae bacterium A322]
MSNAIEFYYDFSSPFGYFASERIEALAARVGRKTVWRPYLMGAVFKAIGTDSLVNIPMKGAYSKMDMERNARLMNIPFVWPEQFPFMSIAACRAFYALVDQDEEGAKALSLALSRKTFAEGQSIIKPEEVLAVAATLGHDPEELGAAMADQVTKDRVRMEVDRALEREVFGTPFFFVDGERFWGCDRMDMMEKWIETGGW